MTLRQSEVEEDGFIIREELVREKSESQVYQSVTGTARILCEREREILGANDEICKM